MQYTSEDLRTEAEVRASESRCRTLVESTSDYIYETDECGRFRYHSSRKPTGFLGYSRRDLASLRFLDLVHPYYRASVEAVLRKQLDEGIRNTYQEFPVRAKYGEVVWLGQSLTLVREGIRSIRYIALARDITERKQTKERRRQCQMELEDLQDWYVATQTTVALAHELNQPLNAVCSYNEAALRMLKDGNPYPEKLQHALSASVQQSERAGKVMRDLIAFLVKGHKPLHGDLVDVNSIVRRAIESMDEEARAGGITIANKLCPDLRVAFAHRLHLEKVICNLLRNSVEAIKGNHDQGGTITVETENQQDSVRVTVRDSGPGFTCDRASRMLEPFYTSKDRGVGMGLPVSRALIEAHGGRLWAEQGTDAVFRFTVPFAK